MSTKLIYLISLVVVLAIILPSVAKAADRGGLVGYWPFDGDTLDKSGSGHHATGVNGPTFVPGITGQAILLDADADPQGQYLTVATPTAVQVPWTAAVWVRRHKDAVNYTASGLLDGGYDGEEWNCLRLEQYQANRKVGFTSYPGNWSWDYLTPIDEWTHLAFIGTDAGITLYANTGIIGTLSEGASEPVWIDWIGKTHSYNCPVDADLDDLAIWNRALTEAEVNAIYKGGPLALDPGKAHLPSPEDGTTDVLRDVVLSWTPGAYANTHDVYLGTVFADVNNADRSNPGSVLASRSQIATTYRPGRLEFSQTYFWRIDEVNAPPDSTIFKGTVWSFTIEPVGYPVAGQTITVTASSADSVQGPENTVNGSGLAGDLHSDELTAMWLTALGATGPAWIQYEFDRVLKLDQMWVWNHNGLLEPMIGFGCKDVTIEYSANGTDYTALGTTHEFARAPGKSGYAHNTIVDFGGITAKYVRLTANSNWGGILNQYGLSEVRFFSIPVLAREPSPVSGATDVSVDVALSWRAGREAAKHDVYLSADEQAVIDGTAPAVTMIPPSYASSLDLASRYYWRIDEVNDVETPTTWQGDVWSFLTQKYLVVDDFESYNDIEAGKEGSNLVYMTWVDGFGTTTNGSTIGYFEAFQPSLETSIVYDGRQSVPLFYNNTTASFSEITANVADLQAGRDWAKHGIKGLTLQFRGDPDNVLQQMYVKINSAKVTYDGSAENVRLKGWQMWYIDLASLGMSLSNVTKLTIGFERIGTLGGQGKVLLDGIRLYSYDRQLITPVDPGTAGLQAQYPFEGNANDSSGKGRNGSGVGNPTFAAGKIGQAVSLNGSNYVEITGYKGVLGGHAFSIAAWIKSISTGDATIVCWGSSTNGQRVDFRLFEGRLRVEHGNGNLQGNTVLADDQWHHVTLTVTENASISYPAVRLYLDGNDDSQTTTDPDMFNIVASVDVNIGRRGTHNDRSFQGLIDDVRIYDRVLTQEEIAWLAGRTLPFDKPF